ncbi:MAG: DUF4430 domain-containing protein [Lactovum sp.]
MEKLKKIVFIFATVILSMTLMACSNTSTTDTSSSVSQSEKISKVSFQIIMEDKKESYSAEEGTNLLDFVKSEFEVDETDGFINSIGNLKSDTQNNAYLMFKVNGEDSAVGAADVELKEGDEIEFYISKF